MVSHPTTLLIAAKVNMQGHVDNPPGTPRWERKVERSTVVRLEEREATFAAVENAQSEMDNASYIAEIEHNYKWNASKQMKSE